MPDRSSQHQGQQALVTIILIGVAVVIVLILAFTLPGIINEDETCEQAANTVTMRGRSTAKAEADCRAFMRDRR